MVHKITQGFNNANPKYWTGQPEENCDICGRNFAGKFVDGATRMGPWANMCLECHGQVGSGLGMGRGQQYEQQEDKRWLKVAG